MRKRIQSQFLLTWLLTGAREQRRVNREVWQCQGEDIHVECQRLLVIVIHTLQVKEFRNICKFNAGQTVW